MDTDILTLQEQTIAAFESAGIPYISMDTCAKIMAVLYKYGNNEYMVLNKKFTMECAYIQRRFHIEGGEIPDATFVEKLQFYVAQCRDDEIPQWASDLFKERYNIKLFV